MAPEISTETKRDLLAQAQHYWHILLKWKWTASLIFFVAVAAATIYTFMLYPIYSASGTIWIED